MGTRFSGPLPFLSGLSVAFFLLLAALHHQSIAAWFIVDDTANIYCGQLPALDLLFAKETYRYCSQIFFTPLLFISFKADWALFGLAPLGYHVHNIVAATACAVLLVGIWEQRIGRLLAVAAAVLFLVSMPISVDVAWITRRHYLWGFFFFLLAARSTLLGRETTPGDDLRGALFLLISLLFKEAFAFLPAAVLLLTPGAPLKRARAAAPYFLALLIYLLWRKLMIGGLGGYAGSEIHWLETSLRLLAMPLDISEAVFGARAIVVLILAAALLADPRKAIVLLVLAYLSLTPFVFFVGDGFELANKTLPFVAICCFAVGTFLARARDRWKRLFWPLVAGTALLFPAALRSAQEAERFLVHLADQHRLASDQILGKTGKVLIVSNYAYYFANLAYILDGMGERGSARVLATGSTDFLGDEDLEGLDRIVLFERNTLDPALGLQSSVKILSPGDAEWREIAANRAPRGSLGKPPITFTQGVDHVDIGVAADYRETVVRCIRMGVYLGCYPLPHKFRGDISYRLYLNGVKPVEKIAMYGVSGDRISEPSLFFPEERSLQPIGREDPR